MFLFLLQTLGNVARLSEGSIWTQTVSSRGFRPISWLLAAFR